MRSSKLKTKDKDLLVNPLADVKSSREGPTFLEQKTTALKNVWSAIKEGMSDWSFGSGIVPPPPPRRGPPRARPPAPQRPKATCPICGTTDCLDRKEMQRLRNKSGSLGNTLLRSCEVRRQLKDMEKFRVRTSGGDDVWMTKQGRIQRPTKPPPPPNPPMPRTVPPKSFPVSRDEELAKLKAENVALKILMDDKLAEKMKIEKAKDAEMKDYHRKKTSEDATEILNKIRNRKRTRPPLR